MSLGIHKGCFMSFIAYKGKAILSFFCGQDCEIYICCLKVHVGKLFELLVTSG